MNRSNNHLCDVEQGGDAAWDRGGEAEYRGQVHRRPDPPHRLALSADSVKRFLFLAHRRKVIYPNKTAEMYKAPYFPLFGVEGSLLSLSGKNIKLRRGDGDIKGVGKNTTWNNRKRKKYPLPFNIKAVKKKIKRGIVIEKIANKIKIKKMGDGEYNQVEGNYLHPWKRGSGSQRSRLGMWNVIFLV